MARTRILSAEEVRLAIRQDSSFPIKELEEYADDATSFISTRTGYDKWGDEDNRIAKKCAKLIVIQDYENKEEYNPEYDYSYGIASYIDDLKDDLRKRGIKPNVQS